jgi:hypothetical protein
VLNLPHVKGHEMKGLRRCPQIEGRAVRYSKGKGFSGLRKLLIHRTRHQLEFLR